MFNNLYDKLIKFIKEDWKGIIIYLIILTLCIVKIPYNLIVGGGVIDLKNRVTVENEKIEKGSFNLSYVKELRATIPTYLVSYIMNWERESVEEELIDENDTVKDAWKREKLYLDESIDNAIISAYHAAGEEINIIEERYKVLYMDKEADTDLEIGDIILSIDGNKITKYDDLRENTNSKNIGDNIIIKVLRDNEQKMCYAKIIEFEGEKKIGLYLIKDYVYETNRKTNIDFSKDEGGPSGGLMMSLTIYNRLTNNDLTKGKMIVGTGTIDDMGNVGEIGGVTYKLYGAYKAGAKIFLVPEGNYEEAYKYKEEKNLDIDLVMVKTLNDAINYLENMR